jgi:hypothetical protein
MQILLPPTKRYDTWIKPNRNETANATAEDSEKKKKEILLILLP